MSANPKFFRTAKIWFCLQWHSSWCTFGIIIAVLYQMLTVLTVLSFHTRAERFLPTIPRWRYLCLHASHSLLQLLGSHHSGRLARLKRKSFYMQLPSLAGGDRERMTANHETYLLMASTQNDMEDWVKTIHRVIWAPFGGGEFTERNTKNTKRKSNAWLALLWV